MTERLRITLRLAILAVFLVVTLPKSISASGSEERIVVVYPKPEQLITAVDSTFILGHVPPRQGDWLYDLFINDKPVAVHKDGGFIAFLPITPGEFTFHLTALLTNRDHEDYQRRIKQHHYFDPPLAYNDSLSETLTVHVPEPLQPVSSDSLLIVKEYDPPAGDLVLSTGQILELSFRGTPACRAWFSIDGVVDSVPMAEIEPRQQPYWGEAVFGAGAVPDSLKLKGIYSGFFTIPATAKTEAVFVCYHLAPPSMADIARRLFIDTDDRIKFNISKLLELVHCESITKESLFKITLNSKIYPFTVEFTDSVQIIRHGPRKGYFSIFQPQGVEALAVGAEGDWYRIQLSRTQFGWVHKTSVEKLPAGVLPPRSYLSSIRFFSSDDKLTIKFPLSGKHPFRIFEDNRRTVRIQLFGVTTDTDWIRYGLDDDLVDLAVWSQPEEGLYELRLQLTQDIWGYDAYYHGSNFCFEIGRAHV